MQEVNHKKSRVERQASATPGKQFITHDQYVVLYLTDNIITDNIITTNKEGDRQSSPPQVAAGDASKNTETTNGNKDSNSDSPSDPDSDPEGGEDEEGKETQLNKCGMFHSKLSGFPSSN